MGKKIPFGNKTELCDSCISNLDSHCGQGHKPPVFPHAVQCKDFRKESQFIGNNKRKEKEEPLVFSDDKLVYNFIE